MNKLLNTCTLATERDKLDEKRPANEIYFS